MSFLQVSFLDITGRRGRRRHISMRRDSISPEYTLLDQLLSGVMSFLQVSFLDITGRRGRRRHISMRRDSISPDTSFVCSVIIFEVSFDSLALSRASTRLRRSNIY